MFSETTKYVNFAKTLILCMGFDSVYVFSYDMLLLLLHRISVSFTHSLIHPIEQESVSHSISHEARQKLIWSPSPCTPSGHILKTKTHGETLVMVLVCNAHKHLGGFGKAWSAELRQSTDQRISLFHHTDCGTCKSKPRSYSEANANWLQVSIFRSLLTTPPVMSLPMHRKKF